MRMADEVFLTWAIVAIWSALWNRRKNEHMFMAGKNKVLSVHESVIIQMSFYLIDSPKQDLSVVQD